MPRDYSCDILTINVADFCLCLTNLSDAKFKNYGLIALAEEFSRQPSSGCVLWLLVFILVQITMKRKKN